MARLSVVKLLFALALLAGSFHTATVFGQDAGALPAEVGEDEGPVGFDDGEEFMPGDVGEDDAGTTPALPAGLGDAPAEDPGGAVLEDDRSPEQIMLDQQAFRQRLLNEADQLFEEGSQLFAEGQYDLARQKLIEAEAKYGRVSLDNVEVLAKQQQTDQLLAEVYVNWADELLRQASAAVAEAGLTDEEDVQGRLFAEAKERYEQAMDLNPELEKMMQVRLRDLKRAQTNAEIRRQVLSVDIERERRHQDILVLLEQGSTLLDGKRYMRAREKFEQVLILDPYNVHATRYLRRLNASLHEDARSRRRVMIRERLAEIEWKWLDPVPSPEILRSGDAQEPAEITSRDDSIRRKLEEIIIPEIAFQEATLQTVVDFLRDRSRALDPDGEGVNFLLYDRIQSDGVPGAAPAPDAPAPEDDFIDFEDIEGIDDGPGFEDPVAGGGPAAAGGSNITITMTLTDMPLGDAVRLICQGNGLQYKVDSNVVIIAIEGVPLERLDTQFFRVSPALFGARVEGGGDDGDADASDAISAEDLRTMFEEFGVEFPEGASMRYVPRVSKIFATNTPDNLRRIELILKELDVPPLQVTIESKFVEIRQTELNELSFQWMFLGKTTDDGSMYRDAYRQDLGAVKFFIEPDSLEASLRNPTSTTVGTRGALFNGGVIIDNLEFDTMVTWLAQQEGIDLLSAPKITTVSGQSAVIRMTEERRFPDSFTEPEFNNDDGVVSYTPPTPNFGDSRDIGVTLTVVPTIDSKDNYTIDLELSPEVTEYIGVDTSYNTTAVVNGEPVTLRFDVPIVEVRSVETRVNVWDGETVILGGTIRDRIQKLDDKVPYIGDLPLIGRLFRARGERSEKRNLLIFVNARIVNPAGLPLRPQDVRGLPDFRR